MKNTLKYIQDSLINGYRIAYIPNKFISKNMIVYNMNDLLIFEPQDRNYINGLLMQVPNLLELKNYTLVLVENNELIKLEQSQIISEITEDKINITLNSIKNLFGYGKITEKEIMRSVGNEIDETNSILLELYNIISNQLFDKATQSSIIDLTSYIPKYNENITSIYKLEVQIVEEIHYIKSIIFGFETILKNLKINKNNILEILNFIIILISIIETIINKYQNNSIYYELKIECELMIGMSLTLYTQNILYIENNDNINNIIYKNTIDGFYIKTFLEIKIGFEKELELNINNTYFLLREFESYKQFLEYTKYITSLTI